MDSEFDLFDDLSPKPVEPRARAGAKFQPKAKPRQTKGTSDVHDDKTKESSSSAKPAGEVGSLGFGLDSGSNAPAATHTSDVTAIGEFQSEAKMLPEKEISALESLSLSNSIVEQPTMQSVCDAEATEHVIPVDDTNKSLNTVGESALKVDSMGLDLDPFGDFLPDPVINNARAGSKFQPRAKALPRKGTSSAAASAVPHTIVEKATGVIPSVPDNIQSAKPLIGDNELANPCSSSLTTLERPGMSRNDDNVSSHILATEGPSSGVGVGDLDAGMGKSVGEDTDIFSVLECVDEVVAQPTSGTEILVPVSDEKGTEGESNFDTKNSVTYSPFMEGLVHCEDDIQVDNISSHSQNTGALHDLDTSEHFPKATFASAISKEQCGTRDAVDSAVSPPVCAASENVGDDPVNFEFPVDRGRTEVREAPQVDNANAVHSLDIPGVPEKESSKGRNERASSARNLSQKHNEAGEMNDGKPSRQLRKRASAPQLVDEPVDGTRDNGGGESPSSNVANEEDHDYEPTLDEDGNDDEDRVESASQKKRASKETHKPVAEKEKTTRKRKGANGVPEQATQERPKKFSHSTRRTRRRVNKELLDMPEDEIDFQMLPIRDIILLAEHKERLAFKESKTSKDHTTTQRTGNTIHRDDSHNEEDQFASDQDRGDTYDQTDSRQPSLSLFNHQSFMDKAPRGRWSKQDTELFYEGVRQFGTDLSMIKQLFPGRTRHEIKLKFKKEERQHPLRFHDAQSNRSTDYSFFKKLIEQLKEAGTPADEESNRDGSICASDNDEAALNAETNEEVAKSERDDDEDAAAEYHEADVEVQDTMVTGDIDDDDFDVWESYKSEL